MKSLKLPVYHTATPDQCLRFEKACVRCLNRWVEVLDIESLDIDFAPLYGEKAAEYNETRGQKDDWEGFHVTMGASYRRATVRAVVLDPIAWCISEDELDRSLLHELIHVVLSPIYEEMVRPYIEGNEDRTKAYRFLDEYITSQLERSIYRQAGPTIDALKRTKKRR